MSAAAQRSMFTADLEREADPSDPWATVPRVPAPSPAISR